MNNNYLLTENQKIFATGVFLQPVKIKINDIEKWHWVAVGFEDESYFNGKCINPMESAKHIKDLLQDFED